MKKEAAKLHFEVIKAFSEGKIIQFKTIAGNWIDYNDPSFSILHEYRIKEESKEESKYKPFTFED